MNERGPSGPSDDRISRLSAAILRISQSLELATVLEEVVEGARALTGARSGVITTIDERGQVQDFVTSGDRSASRATRNTFSGRAPWPTRSSAENARPPNRRMVMATWGLAGGVQMATREPSSSRASRMGRVAGSSPSGLAMWIAAR